MFKFFDYSVVVPCYNCGKYINECILSILSQKFPPKKIIVVDDGSTDETASILKKYKKDKNFVCVKQENKGVSFARNLGVKKCETDFVAFIDADDVWVSDKMEKQMPLFSNKLVGVVYSLRYQFDKNGIVDKYKHVDVFRGNVLEQLMSHNFLCASSVVVRRSCFMEVDGFDCNLTQGEDLDLWIRIAINGHLFVRKEG